MAGLNSRTGYYTLITAHCVGMTDLVALPVWMGTLISHYQLDPQQSGGLVTLFLFCGVLASILLSPRIANFDKRIGAILGFSFSGLAFLAMTWVSGFPGLALLHAMAGLATGAALTCTHGTMGQTVQPHRIFGLASVALGAYGMLFFASSTHLVQVYGGAALFQFLAVIMFFATLVCLCGFPSITYCVEKAVRGARPKLPKVIWFGILGISCLTLVQAMIFSFVEVMARHRGMEGSSIVLLLTAVGVCNLLAALAATFLEKRVDARLVIVLGPLLQGLIALAMTLHASQEVFIASTVMFVTTLVISHTFVFGLLARLDTSGRAVAATPAMMMAGSAIGPLLGGTLVKLEGFTSLGFAALTIDTLAVLSMGALAYNAYRRSTLVATV